MSERRNAYRVPTDGSMQAELRAEEGVWRGLVVDTSDGGVRVVFPPFAAPTLKVGAGSLEVELSGGPLSGVVTLAATVRMRSDAVAWPLAPPGEKVEVVEYGLGFRDPRQVARLLPPAARQAFNRRREARVPAPEDSSHWVTVQAAEGEHRGRKLVGRLVDVSAGGLGLMLPTSSEEVLATSPTVTCAWSGPGRARERSQAGRIVNRTLIGEEIRYGVSFLTPTHPAAVRESYEASWDCVVCGTRLLLAQSHAHCPGCGTPRGDQATYFPEWEEAELNTAHWATGTERCCAFCDITFSDLVTFCGRCGRPLP